MPIQAPNWTEYLSCPVCCHEFAANLRPPISLGCGHTICRTCLATLHRKQCPFDQTLITTDLDNLPVNYALLQLVSNPSPTAKHHHDHENSSPSVQKLNPSDLTCYNVAKECIEQLALYLKPFTNGNLASVLSRPMQRKLVTLVNCQLVEDEGRSRALRAARSLGERTVTELILQHQNPQQLSANLWAAVRARGCQFLGPAMQEEVLKLVLLALEDGSALSRKVLVMFVVQRLEPHFPQASKTSIGHVVQLLYRASCFKVSKREGDSSLMQLKEEFRTYEALRREHDAQIVQIATEAGLRIAPDQWSALLYGDTGHKSHMQSIIDKLQTPQSFAQSVQELVIALQRTGDPANLDGLRSNLKHLANIDPSTEGSVPTWEEVAVSLDAVKEVVVGLVEFVQHHGNRKLQETCHSNHNAKYKISMCRDLVMRSTCPRGTNCTFAHSKEELEKYQAKSRKINSRTPTVPGKDAVMDYMSEHNLSNASSSFTDESSPRRFAKTQLPPALTQPQFIDKHNGPMQPSQISNANLHVPSMAHRLQYDMYSGGPINYPPPTAPTSMQNGAINRGMNIRSPRPVPTQNIQTLTSQPPPPPPQYQHSQAPMYSPMQMNNNYPPPDVFNTSYPPPSAHPLHYQHVSPVTVPTDFNNSGTYSINPRQADMQQRNTLWDQKQHQQQQQQQQQQQRLMVPMPPQQQNQMKPSISTSNYHPNTINMNNPSASEAIRNLHSLELRRQEILKQLENMQKPAITSINGNNVYKPIMTSNSNNNKDDLLSNYWPTVSTTASLPSTATGIGNNFNVDQSAANRNTYDRSISILTEDDVTIPFDSMQTTSNIYGPISRMPKINNSSSYPEVTNSLFGESSRSPISPQSSTPSTTHWLQQLHQQKPIASRELNSFITSGAASVSSPGCSNGVNTSYGNDYSKFGPESLYYAESSADLKINDLAIERMAKSVGGNSFKFPSDKAINSENHNQLTMELKLIEKTLLENGNEDKVNQSSPNLIASSIWNNNDIKAPVTTTTTTTNNNLPKANAAQRYWSDQKDNRKDITAEDNEVLVKDMRELELRLEEQLEEQEDPFGLM
ncbi:hypothetical protein HA402_001425 [Bradysia odoriphaga]|nr:hypothetical protein HA402_001425 [Bradysia odoriphaga]